MNSGINDFSSFLVHTIMSARDVIFKSILEIEMKNNPISAADLQPIIDNTRVILMIALSTNHFKESERTMIWQTLIDMHDIIINLSAMLFQNSDFNQCVEPFNDIENLLVYLRAYQGGVNVEVDRFDCIQGLKPFTPPENDKIPVCIVQATNLVYRQARYIPEHICEDPTYGDFIRLLALVNRIEVRQSTMTRVQGAVWKSLVFTMKHCIGFSISVFERYTLKGILW